MTHTPRFEPVTTVRAYERVVEQVEQAILSGSLKAGDRLPSERELIAQFGVSRSTVREALRVLESSGLVRSRPGDPQGPEVLPLSGAALEKSMLRLLRFEEVSLLELLEFRFLVDGFASFLAASRHDDSALEAIEATIDAMMAATSSSYTEFSAADVAFHDAVAVASGNALIQVCCAAVRGVVVQLIATRIADADDQRALMETSLEHHREVLAALRSHDGSRAAQLARAHLFEYYAAYVDDAEREMLRQLVAGSD